MKGMKDIGQYKALGASGAIAPVGGSVLRFICSTAGTLTITEGIVGGGATIVASMPVAAGSVYPMLFDCPAGAFATLAGGATGTFVG
jgi:hypothetical protein